MLKLQTKVEVKRDLSLLMSIISLILSILT
jgi:hypothetical protein